MKESTKSWLRAAGRATGEMVLAYGRAARIDTLMQNYHHNAAAMHVAMMKMSLTEQQRILPFLVTAQQAVTAVFDDPSDDAALYDAECAVIDLRMWGA